MIIYAGMKSSPKKKSSKAVRDANVKHRQWLAEMGYLPQKQKKVSHSLKVEIDTDDRKLPPLSNTIPMGVIAAKKSIDDHRWKRNLKESKETIDQIEAKKKRIAPHYSKGAAQYITDQTDATLLGKKV